MLDLGIFFLIESIRESFFLKIQGETTVTTGLSEKQE